MKVLILDPTGPAPYRDTTLEERALGGTEGTIIRVAEALALEHEVTVGQCVRTDSVRSGRGVRYVPFPRKSVEPIVDEPDVVILVRAYKLLKRVRRTYPRSRLILWLHCFPGKSRKDLNAEAVENEATIVTVSQTHRDRVLDFIDTYRERPTVYSPAVRTPVRYIFNPIADELQPDGTAVDPNKLVFFSSPHKGLEQVLHALETVRRRRPETRLCIANPGYLALADDLTVDGVEVLGSLPHAEVLRHVREAYCVFYPQYRFEETFGLIFAEANAVGTPVLAHPTGSAREVLRDDRQLVDARDTSCVAERLLSWDRNGRPEVGANPDFRLSVVASRWRTLFEETEPPSDGDHEEQLSAAA